LDRIKRFGLITAVAAIALLVPTRAASDTPPPTIEVSLSLTDLPAPIVNLSVPESQPNVNITVPETRAPVVNLDMPAPIVNVESQEPQVIYQDRTVEVERIVEVPACLDYADLPYFDLANALSVAFPGEPWSLNGSHYNGLVWYGETPQPDMTAIIGGWLTHLTESC
jgi:hypothetical protein